MMEVSLTPKIIALIQLVQAHNDFALKELSIANLHNMNKKIKPDWESLQYFLRLPPEYVEHNGLKRDWKTFRAIVDYPLDDLRQMFDDDIEKYSPPLNIEEIHPHA